MEKQCFIFLFLKYKIKGPCKFSGILKEAIKYALINEDKDNYAICN